VSKATKVVVVCVVVGAAVPAVVFAGGFQGSEVFEANTQTYDSVGPQTTNSTQFTPLGDLEMSPVGIGAQVTLSATMTSGKAKFRFASEDFDPQPVPIPAAGVVFSAPASNSYAFFDRDSCGNFSVEWRRSGNQQAALSQASLQAIGDTSAC
jgi:hypothetical protein